MVSLPLGQTYTQYMDMVQEKLGNREIQEWQRDVGSKSTLATYSLIKKYLETEPYLNSLPSDGAKLLFKIRSNTFPAAVALA